MIKIKEKFHYQCINCGKIYSTSEIRYLCPDCETENRPGKPPKGILKVVYPYEEIKNKNLDFNMSNFNGFIDLLSVRSLETVNIVLSTGSGLKDLKAVQKKISLPEAIEPSLA